MRELFQPLGPTARVLDLGSAGGSFDHRLCAARLVRVDLEAPRGRPEGNFVRGDASALPFRDGSFELVVSNHSLEHFDRLDEALAEVRRVLSPAGTLYVAVPDATTLTDRVYRWLARGGGHVNAFTGLAGLAAVVEKGTKLRMSGARVLCTSLSFLNRRNHPCRAPRRLWLLGGGNEGALRLLTLLLRLVDRFLGARCSVYGWHCTFGPAGEEPAAVCEPPWTNVCVRCGSGHSSQMLERGGLVAGRVVRSYCCPGCGAFNYYTDDAKYSKLA